MKGNLLDGIDRGETATPVHPNGVKHQRHKMIHEVRLRITAKLSSRIATWYMILKCYVLVITSLKITTFPLVGDG
ncbi:hypotheticalprotein-conserved [Sesbania bispinosa]|nr:hypotheticalprotein-conserved [Sesbania bispinosa]